MLSALITFTAFTLYIVFAHGFTIFAPKNPFGVVEPKQAAGAKAHGIEVTINNTSVIGYTNCNEQYNNL